MQCLKMLNFSNLLLSLNDNLTSAELLPKPVKLNAWARRRSKFEKVECQIKALGKVNGLTESCADL